MNNKGWEAETGSRGTGSRRWFWRAASSTLVILISVAVAAGWGKGGNQSAGKPDEKLTLTVRVYNYAHVSSHDLAGAERVASKIYERVGVELSWIDCPATREEAQHNLACLTAHAPTEIDLRAVSDLGDATNLAESTMGFAQATPRPDRGWLATISYARAKRQLLDWHELTLGQLFGYGMAHEIGHLLLGTNSHSPSGLMSARWNLPELALAGSAQLNFSSAQAASIRSDVRARLKAQESQSTGVASAK